ncbi:hypothetical protein MUO32_26620 [Shinella sp. CPCC 101442]|uniref:hypothetical protein n=1 Tax=Shinella sp. CPCC 101442 TaxID=2932265 RepID=UPI00215246B3|nr:hypothetical protein [Shinella sp. CPCC 101442]MCR6502606.1 hypothetical protein [Shinella sp. CPCC 101442]
MRISVEKRTRGFAAWQRTVDAGRRVTVLLDGVVQLHCLMADSATGEIKRQVINAFGEIVEDPETGDVVTELVTGSVSITIVGG